MRFKRPSIIIFRYHCCRLSTSELGSLHVTQTSNLYFWVHSCHTVMLQLWTIEHFAIMTSRLPCSMLAASAALCFALITLKRLPSPTSDLFEGWLSHGSEISNTTTNGQRISFHAFNSFSAHKKGIKLYFKPKKELRDETFQINFPGAISKIAGLYRWTWLIHSCAKITI
jgi:hypothetical protein